ncbi:MAG: O-methyltransferase [Syntrophales bacterium]
MSSGSSLPYRLRPNKAVDRELFLSLLGRLAATLRIESYRYVGLGGPFLEDFRLIHARLGIADLKCIESEESVHHRQNFNRPVSCIECINSTLEDYIDSTDFEKPVIIWFDNTDPGKITEQIERFSRTISVVPINSILRVTLNANPSSLGKPDNFKDDIHECRLDRFRERLGSLFPSDLKKDGMKTKNYGRSVLRALYLAVEKEILSLSGRKIVWSLATHYADGQPMTTAALIVCDSRNDQIESLVKGWEFFSTPEDPFLLDMPSLSTLERLTMESCDDAKERLGFELPKSEMGENPFESFKKFYRVFPHFSRVEL